MGLYATSPDNFSDSQDIVHIAHNNRGLRVEERLRQDRYSYSRSTLVRSGHLDGGIASMHIILNCPHSLVGIGLQRSDSSHMQILQHSFNSDAYSCLGPTTTNET